MFPYGESKEKWDKLVDLLVKYNIYLEIIRIVKDTQSQQGAPISETGGEEQLDTVREIIENETKFEFLGKQYVFRDVQAIQSAVTNPKGFLGETFLTSGESAKDFKNEDIVLLYNNNDGFYPREDINDIRLLLTTMRNINGKGGLSVLWDPSRLSSDTGNIRSTDLELITGRLDDPRVTHLYFPNDPNENIPTDSLGAPKFQEVVGQDYIKMRSASAQAIPKINDLFIALAEIMEPHLQTPLLEEKYRRLYKEVLDAIRADLFSAAVEEKVLEAVAPAESNVHQERFDELAQLAPEFSVRSLTPFDFQCFLMENIGIIADKQEKLKSATKVSSKPEAYHSIDPYKHVVPLKGEPGTVISKINHGAKTEEVKKLMDLDPTVYGMLVPYIKIYRIDYDKESPAKPIEQKELPIPNFLDPNDIKQLTGKGSGRYKGFGLKSFNWKLDGLQPATVDNNISANLTFYFQSVNDLFQGSLAAGQTVPNPLDLLISPETIKATDPENAKGQSVKAKPKNCSMLKENLHQKYDGANFRIKVVSGWATPPNLKALLPSWEMKDINLLVRAIDSTRITLYLHQVRHNLNFKQDGTVELSIDYQAALTGILQSKQADILGASDESLVAQTKGLKNKIERVEEELDELLENQAAGRDVKDSVKAQKEKLKNAVEEMKALEEEDRLKKYKRFLENLYESGKIYVAEVPTGEILREPLGEIDDPEERASRALQRLSTDTRKRGYKLFDQADLDPEAPRHATRGKTDIRGAIDEGLGQKNISVKEVGSAADKSTEDQWSSPRLSDADTYIPYFYLGDLIDTIFARNRAYFIKNNMDKGFMTFLSDVDVIDPLLLFQVKNVTDVACADTIDDALLVERLKEEGLVTDSGGIRKRINIGSIPISLDQFNIWFKDNVIKKERTSYYLIHFMKDICNGLISRALGSSCFKNDPVNFLRFDTSIVHFNNENKKIKNGVTTTVKQLATQKGALNENNDIPPANATEEQKKKYSSVSGLVLYSTDAKPQARDGNYLEDLSSGIYHNYIGSAAGLVKSINFDRVDQKGLREAKIEKRGALGAEQLRELYTARLSMIGNTLFKNGQYTFIWPTLVSSDDKYATLLGLGGYFMVVSVDHTISTKGYDVSVRALQQGLRFGKTDAVVADAYNVQPTDPAPDLAEWMQARGLGEEDTSSAQRDLTALEETGAISVTTETPEVSRQNIAIANAYAQGTRPPG